MPASFPLLDIKEAAREVVWREKRHSARLVYPPRSGFGHICQDPFPEIKPSQGIVSKETKQGKRQDGLEDNRPAQNDQACRSSMDFKHKHLRQHSTRNTR